MNRVLEHAAWFARRFARVALLVLAWGTIAACGKAADDLVLDATETSPQTALRGGVVILGGHQGRVVVNPRGLVRQPEYDLGGLFDQHAFGRLAGVNQVFIVNGRQAVGAPNAMDRALALVRQRCEERIATLEKVCRLEARQVRTLAVAMESDLKRLASHIEAERERYGGRTMPATPQGVDRKVLEDVRDRALQCRRVLESLPGPDSLLGCVMHDILSPDQARAFSTWIERRRACRWRAMVKTVLAQMDEAGLGLVTAQALAIETSLLDDMPPLDVLRDGSVGNLDGRMPQFQTILVTSRLGRHREHWDHLLDSRQQAILTKRIESCGDPVQVEAMLVEQGILEQDGSPARAKETN